jgi:hypothetical protein
MAIKKTTPRGGPGAKRAPKAKAKSTSKPTASAGKSNPQAANIKSRARGSKTAKQMGDMTQRENYNLFRGSEQEKKLARQGSTGYYDATFGPMDLPASQRKRLQGSATLGRGSKVTKKESKESRLMQRVYEQQRAGGKLNKSAFEKKMDLVKEGTRKKNKSGPGAKNARKPITRGSRSAAQVANQTKMETKRVTKSTGAKRVASAKPKAMPAAPAGRRTAKKVPATKRPGTRGR